MRGVGERAHVVRQPTRWLALGFLLAPLGCDRPAPGVGAPAAATASQAASAACSLLPGSRPVLLDATFTRGAGAPVAETRTFASGGSATGTVCLDLVDVSSAVVVLNGAALFGPSDFKSRSTTLSKEEVPLTNANSLPVEMRGKPCAGAGGHEGHRGNDNRGNGDGGAEDPQDGDDSQGSDVKGNGEHDADESEDGDNDDGDEDGDDEHGGGQQGDDDRDGHDDACATMHVRVLGSIPPPPLAPGVFAAVDTCCTDPSCDRASFVAKGGVCAGDSRLRGPLPFSAPIVTSK